MVLDMEMSMLKENGYTVLAAITTDLAQTLAMEHPGPIHLLISDVIMPEMNGRELSEKLMLLRPDMKVLSFPATPQISSQAKGWSKMKSISCRSLSRFKR